MSFVSSSSTSTGDITSLVVMKEDQAMTITDDNSTYTTSESVEDLQPTLEVVVQVNEQVEVAP